MFKSFTTMKRQSLWVLSKRNLLQLLVVNMNKVLVYRSTLMWIIFLKWHCLSFGDAKDWTAFRGLFNDMVVKSNDSSKLSYLKDSLKNEPFYLIKNLTVRKGNFKAQVWKKLLGQYDNNRNIIYASVNALLNLKQTMSESAESIRK